MPGGGEGNVAKDDSYFVKFWISLLPLLRYMWLLEKLHQVKLFSNRLIFTRCSKTFKFCWSFHKLNIRRSHQKASKLLGRCSRTIPLDKVNDFLYMIGTNVSIQNSVKAAAVRQNSCRKAIYKIRIKDRIWLFQGRLPVLRCSPLLALL